MSDSSTSGLENPSSVDGTANAAYRSSTSDSERSLSRDRSGETEPMPARGAGSFPGPSEVSSAKTVTDYSGADADNWVSHFRGGKEASLPDDGADAGLRRVAESGKSHPDRREVVDEPPHESDGSAPCRQTSEPIGARLVVSAPALDRQSSVRVPAPMPRACSSLASNGTAASSYSDSELVPQKNSVPHNVAKMVATEYLVLKQQPTVPRVYVLTSGEMSEEAVPSESKPKPSTAEQRRQNRGEIQKKLHQWQRSLSAGDKPSSQHLLPDGGVDSNSKPRSRGRSHLLKHTISSPGHGPVQGNADVAGVTPDSLLCSSVASAVTPDAAANHSSHICNADDSVARNNSITETATSQTSAKELENVQSDDGVFDEESGNNQKCSSADVIDTWQRESVDPPASTSAISSGHRNGVPNRAILRRGSGKLFTST